MQSAANGFAAMDPGAKCQDRTGRKYVVTVDSSAVHLNKPGVYTATYICIDSAGETIATTDRHVAVTEAVATESQKAGKADGMGDDDGSWG
jgi:hypothetical protein